MGAIREVRKRDGRVVPFDGTKIADAIYKAIRSVGKGDRGLAEELAAAVAHFLEKKFDEGIPGIEDIQDQVETVLIETGHAEIAKAYILYRNKRASVRELLQVRKAPPDRSVEGAGGPEMVEDRFGVAPWSKSKITAALIREADMEIGVAEDIASVVERKVFASGMERISTSLIRELVDNELFERGFSSKLFRQAPIGLPKYNLEQIIFGADTKEGFTFPKTPVEVRDLIATEILEQYALEEITSRAVSDAHRDGRIHIHGLGDPIRLSHLTWDLAGPPSPARGRRADDGRLAEGDRAELFRELPRLAHFVSGEVRLRGASRLVRAGGPDPLAGFEEAFGRLKEIQTGPPRAVFALELDLPEEARPWLRTLVDRPVTGSPLLYLHLGRGRPVGEALRHAASLFVRGDPIEFIPGRSMRLRGASRSGLQPFAAKITLNLARAAFRSASDRAGRMEREVDEALDLAVKGHLERRRFLERLGANPENPLWDLLGRPRGASGKPLVDLASVEFPVGVVGLNEAVKFLTGFELHQDPRAARAGRSILEACARKLRNEGRVLGLRFPLVESRNAGSVRRLEDLDRRRFPLESEEIERGRAGAGRTGGPAACRYTDGVRLARHAPVDPLRRIEHLGGYLDLVLPAGVIEDSPELRSGGSEVVLSLLEESLPYLEGTERSAPVPEATGG